MMFIDIDSYSKSLSDYIFRRKLSKKVLMLRQIEKSVKQGQYSDIWVLGFTILIKGVEF